MFRNFDRNCMVGVRSDPMNPYAAHTWMGADTAHAYHQGAGTATSRLPTLPELLADIHALDAEIQQTDLEIAAQLTPNNAAFVDYYWRPFVGYWDRAMREVYYYEHRALKDAPPSVATADMVFWGARAKYQTLRQDAEARWGFNLGRLARTAIGFVPPWLWFGLGLGGLGAAALAITARRDEYRDAAWIRRNAQREAEWWTMRDIAVRDALARRDHEWQTFLEHKDQEWLMDASPVTGCGAPR